MKKKIFLPLFIVITVFVSIFSCNKDEEKAPGALTKALNLNFKQYAAPDYLCGAPVWNSTTIPSILLADMSLIDFDFKKQVAEGKSAIKVSVNWINSKGKPQAFSKTIIIKLKTENL
ncbi:MAG: hypothetical protein ACO3E1_03350 [Flavobacteriales bacterium]